MIKDLLFKIENKYGNSILKSAEDNEILDLTNWISNNICKYLDTEQYYSFFRKVNGLDFNGLVIYGASLTDDNNVIESNKIWRENEWMKDYLFIGYSDISWFCLNINTNLFLELDKPSGEIIEKYNNFNDMIENALKNVIS